MCAPFIPVNLPITGNQYQNRELPHGNVSRSEVEHHRSKDIPDVIKEGKNLTEKQLQEDCKNH